MIIRPGISDHNKELASLSACHFRILQKLASLSACYFRILQKLASLSACYFRIRPAFRRASAKVVCNSRGYSLEYAGYVQGATLPATVQHKGFNRLFYDYRSGLQRPVGTFKKDQSQSRYEFLLPIGAPGFGVGLNKYSHSLMRVVVGCSTPTTLLN